MARSHTTTKNRTDLIEMFLDATIGESYWKGRLRTETDGETVQLIAYGRHILGEVDRAAKSVTLYSGHYGVQSPTVTDYVRLFGKRLALREGYDVTISERAPDTDYDTLPQSSQYINQYIDYTRGKLSGAEKKARREVDNALLSTF